MLCRIHEQNWKSFTSAYVPSLKMGKTTSVSNEVNIVTSLVTLAPKSQPAPLGLIAQVSTSSGSDQTRSQNAPLWGISWFRSMVRIWSRVLMSGESPPCTQRICSSINCELSEVHNHQYNTLIICSVGWGNICISNMTATLNLEAHLQSFQMTICSLSWGSFYITNRERKD